MKNFKSIVFEAVVTVDIDKIEEIANELYDGDVNAAIHGELGWVAQSGISIQLGNAELTEGVKL